MEITTNQLSLTGVIMENPQFDHEVFGEAFFRTVRACRGYPAPSICCR